MKKRMIAKSLLVMLTVTSLMVLINTAVFAAGSGMPWESLLTKILNSIAGPVAKAIGTIVIIITGLQMAFGEGGGGMRKAVNIVFGLSIAFTASSFFLNFFGYSGGVEF